MLFLARTLCRTCQKFYGNWYKSFDQRFSCIILLCFNFYSSVGLLKQSSVQYRWNSESVSEELFIPTTFNKLEASDSAPMVNGYTTQGFIVNGNTVYGSVALLPRGILNWKVCMLGIIEFYHYICRVRGGTTSVCL